MTDQHAQQTAGPGQAPRVTITATVDYTLSVPAAWVQDPESEYHQDPHEAVFTWIVDNPDQCIAEIDLADHTVDPTPGQRRERICQARQPAEAAALGATAAPGRPGRSRRDER